MRILTRYILVEMVVVFSLILTGMTAFIFFCLIAKEAVDNGLSMGPILRILPYMLPQALQFTVPGALLLASTSVYGRISSSNEIVAIKSLGVSPMTMIWPAIILAGLISLGAVVMNDLAVWGRDGVERVILESLEEIAYGKLRASGNYTNSRVRVNVRRLEGRRMIMPYIQITSTNGGPPSMISADAAELHADAAAGAMTIRLFNASGNISDWTISHPGEFERSFSMEEFTGHRSDERHPTSFALHELAFAKAEQLKFIERLKRKMAADMGSALLFGKLDALAQSQWQGRENEVAAAERTCHRLFTEPYRRWANGFSCLGFLLIGAPMSIRRKNGEFWGSFFLCFLPILIVYYPLLVGCLNWAKNGVLPPQSVWLGNFVLAAWGVWLLRRVIRF